jgi:hypothetical protein
LIKGLRYTNSVLWSPRDNFYFVLMSLLSDFCPVNFCHVCFCHEHFCAVQDCFLMARRCIITTTLINASKEVSQEVNVETTKYMLVSRYRNADQSRDIKNSKHHLIM